MRWERSRERVCVLEDVCSCLVVVVRMMGPCAVLPVLTDEEGMACGYCEGAAGLGRRPELLVNGWVASGSKEERTELDMVAKKGVWSACGGV